MAQEPHLVAGGVFGDIRAVFSSIRTVFGYFTNQLSIWLIFCKASCTVLSRVRWVPTLDVVVEHIHIQIWPFSTIVQLYYKEIGPWRMMDIHGHGKLTYLLLTYSQDTQFLSIETWRGFKSPFFWISDESVDDDRTHFRKYIINCSPESAEKSCFSILNFLCKPFHPTKWHQVIYWHIGYLVQLSVKAPQSTLKTKNKQWNYARSPLACRQWYIHYGLGLLQTWLS